MQPTGQPGREGEQLIVEKDKAERAEADRAKERIEGLLKVDLLGLEVGYGLIRYVDTNRRGFSESDQIDSPPDCPGSGPGRSSVHITIIFSWAKPIHPAQRC